VKIQVEVFWVVTPCCAVVGYQRFGATLSRRVSGVEWSGVEV